MALIEIPEPDIVRDIGDVCNYYGGVAVCMKDGKYYWSVENYDGHDWEQIPKSLYDELNNFQDDSV